MHKEQILFEAVQQWEHNFLQEQNTQFKEWP